MPSNCVISGNPGKVVSHNIFWDTECVHAYKDAETKKSLISDKTENIFKFDENEYVSFDKLDEMLSKKISAKEKLEEIKDFIQHYEKNRFAFKR